LKWSDFSERTENSFVDKTIASQIHFTPYEYIRFGVGVRYFSQTRYEFANGTKTLDSFFRSFGPTCLIVWDIGTFSRLSFKGWYERRTFTGNRTQGLASSQSLPNMSMDVIINL
jgi:hypothetical protein